MKRYSVSLTALTVTAAMAIAAGPAVAQPTEGTPPANDAPPAVEEDQTFEGETYTTQDGTIFYRHDDGIHWVDAPERALPGVELSPEELNRSAEIQDTVNADYAAVVEETVPLSYETLDGQVFYRTTDGTYWVDTPDRAAGSLNDQELQRS